MGDFVRPESRLRREISTVNSAELETQQLLLQLHTYGQVWNLRRDLCRTSAALYYAWMLPVRG